MTGRSGKFPVIVPGPSFRVGNQLSQSQGPGWGEKASKVLPGRLPTLSAHPLCPLASSSGFRGWLMGGGRFSRADLVQATTLS